MNFVIYAPGDYTPNGGGCVALHKLCHNINSLGEKCYIMTDSTNPKYLGEMVDERKATELCEGGAMAIYPEVTCGNPFNAYKVMRWILYNVRTKGEYGIFGADDLIYKYAPHFTLRHEQPVHGELRAVELNLDIFYNRNGLRSGCCHLVKKGNNKHQTHPHISVMLDDYPIRGGNEYLAKVFNETEIFYSYDSATFLSVFASLCGCTSLVMPEEGVTSEQWHQGFPYFKYGVAYGHDDIDYAKSTAHLLEPELLKIEAETIELTKAFIKKAYEL
jgi:hypothetical protein